MIVDDPRELADSTLDFHERLVRQVPRNAVDNGRWRFEIFKGCDISEVMNEEMLESIFGHLADLGKTTNKRIYIGPGRDGSSDDKIAVDCKFDPMNTAIPFNKTWGAADYRKSTFKWLGEAAGSSNEWELIEDQEKLKFTTRYCRNTAMTLHQLGNISTIGPMAMGPMRTVVGS